MGKLSLILLATIVLTGCAKNTEPPFAKLAEEFVYTTLSFSPVSATATGLHRRQDRNLDELLDDVSPAALERQKKFYQDFRARLEREVKRDVLDAQSRADYDILEHQVSLALLDFDEIKSYAHNPTVYVESVGNALFNPWVLKYAPKPQRLRHIIARLQKLPAFLKQARGNLVSAPGIWTRVAMEENEGNIGLVDKTLREDMPADLRAAYDAAAGPALDALRKFQEFLKTDLAKRDQWDWRLGQGEVRQEVPLRAGHRERTRERCWQQAERDLEAVREQHARTARCRCWRRTMYRRATRPASI